VRFRHPKDRQELTYAPLPAYKFIGELTGELKAMTTKHSIPREHHVAGLADANNRIHTCESYMRDLNERLEINRGTAYDSDGG
jgi:hypothetical protein